MKEQIRGVDIEDYTTLSIDSLSEIVALDNQLVERLKKIKIDILTGFHQTAVLEIEDFLDGTIKHIMYTQECIDYAFKGMESAGRLRD